MPTLARARALRRIVGCVAVENPDCHTTEMFGSAARSPPPAIASTRAPLPLPRKTHYEVTLPRFFAPMLRLRLSLGPSPMRAPHSPELRQRAIALARQEGRLVAKGLGVTQSCLRKLATSGPRRCSHSDAPRTAERKEIALLRSKNEASRSRTRSCGRRRRSSPGRTGDTRCPGG